MKYGAVIFDLFGTLVDNVQDGPYAASIRATAAAAGAEAEEFLRRWTDGQTALRRSAGQFGTQARCIEHICRQMGLSPDPDAVRRAARVRFEAVRAWLVCRPDAVDTLEGLRRIGLKLCLMSVCSPDTPILWPRTPLAPRFDEALFSCKVALNKPDPRFYALACERLDLQPRQCLYVGDGAGNELTGARRAGMDAVLICAPHEEDFVMAREEARNWTGPRIASPSEVLQLVA